MWRVIITFASWLVFKGVSSLEIIESELAQLPKLFHLDDYDRCLAEKEGVYCVGQFQIYSDYEDHPTYNLIKKYEQDKDIYNRSYFHHGYCLSERCPGSHSNLTARFEACADRWLRRRHGLRARLLTLHYCQTHGQLPSNAQDTQSLPHRVFLYAIYFLVLMNIVGTIYDQVSKETEDKKDVSILRLWSIPRNWEKLTKVTEEPEAFSNIDLSRFLLINGAIFCHVLILTAMTHQRDPRNIEKFLNTPVGPATGALTTITQHFVVVSNFLTTYKLLQDSKTNPISFKRVPLEFLKRIIRLLPLYLLLNGFAATWWANMGDGPMWPVIVGHESNVCRHKFWVTAGFLQNVIEPEKICLVQTWIMAVDTQIHIFTLLTIALLVKYRQWAVQILSALLVGAVGLTIFVTFRNGYISFFNYVTPEVFRTAFMYTKSFTHLFIMPTNCMIAAVTGIIMGLVIFESEERKIKKRFLWMSGTWIVVAVFLVAHQTYYLKLWVTDPWTITAFMTVERIVFCFLAGGVLYAATTEDLYGYIARWPAWRVTGKISMAVSMVHWCINAYLVATRKSLHDTSVIGMVSDVIVTSVISHAIAVPLTVLVQYPAQAFLMRILNL